MQDVCFTYGSRTKQVELRPGLADRILSKLIVMESLAFVARLDRCH